MKIKSSNTQTTTSTKKSKATPKTSTFDALLASQFEAETSIETPQAQTDSTDVLKQKEPAIEEMLQTLETCMSNLENNTESQQLAEQALHQLRHALSTITDTHLLSPQDKQEAETLLVVEARRLALLRKFESS